MAWIRDIIANSLEGVCKERKAAEMGTFGKSKSQLLLYIRWKTDTSHVLA
ncbi:hypothetical protein [Bacillus thuringiensis]|nr:hypothetical protein [Bacillus thuringiensis]